MLGSWYPLWTHRAHTTPRLSGCLCASGGKASQHHDVIKWKHFPRYWPFVRGIHWSPVNSPHKGQWRRALMFSLICAWINGWENNREAGDLRRHRVLYDVTVMGSRNQHTRPDTHHCIIMEKGLGSTCPLMFALLWVQIIKSHPFGWGNLTFPDVAFMWSNM